VGGRSVGLRAGAALFAALLAFLAAGCGGGDESDRVDASGEWTLAAPRSEGVDAATLRRLDEDVRRTEPGLRSLLVVRHGRLVFERYYGGAGPQEPFDVRSVTKSVVSTLVGIAQADGKIKGVDEPLARIAPWTKQLSGDARLERVTLRQLLTMSAGLSTPPEALGAPSPIEQIVFRPLTYDPGTAFQYDDGTAHLVSAIVAATTGERTEAYARERLWGPLGIEPPRWSVDGTGLAYGSAGLHMRARDLAKLGQLYLQEGRWHGDEIVPADWVREATRKQVSGGAPLGEPYGYFWWVLEEWPGAYAAIGYGGQVIAVFPKQDAVVVLTSEVSGQTQIGEILGRIVPALGSRPG
jgi:CubicO group peptidase (beta-lactamase class C family)